MGRRSPRTIVALSFVVVSLMFGSIAGPAAPVASAAGGGGNASINLTKTISAVTVTPTLGLALSVDRPTAIPGDTLTYTATLTNSAANLKLTGTFVAQNSSTVATVAADYDVVEYFSIQQNAWVPIAGAATTKTGYTPAEPAPIGTGLILSATGRPTAGVTYASGADHIVGTVLNGGKTATWDYTATILLSPTQLALLQDPTKVSKIRNVIHFEVTPRDPSVGQPFTFRADFITQLRAGSGTVTNATITITPPSGAPTVFDQTTTPTLASIPSGASRTVQSTYLVPLVTAKGGSETDADYATRLHALDGRALTAKADATATGGGATISAAQQTVTTAEQLPILSIDKTGPATVDAGTTIAYDIALANIGSAPASGLVVTDALPAGATGTVTDVPASIAPAGSATAHAAYDVPTTQPEGPLTDTASVTWKDANGNAYGPLSDAFTTQVQNTLVGAHLILSPATAGPLPVGSEHTLTAALTDRNDAPVVGQPVHFAVTGPNATAGDATTNASGVATFTYQGDDAGTDQAQATATKNATTVQSNTASASWIAPVQPVSITNVHGNFYANTGVAHFTATPASTPVFGQDFPTIDFNPPAGTVLNNISGVGTTTRPFTDLTTDINGNYTGSIVAEGDGHQAGVGDLTHFDAVFDGSFVVTQASDVTFNVFSDAGFILGVGGGASRVSGAFENPPASGTTPFRAFPVVGAYNLDSAPAAHPVTIHFPAPGTYPFEIDYFECCDSQLSLTLTTVSFIGDTSPLSVYVGYADGLRPAGSVFPFPWNGAPGVTFIGNNGTYDSGALRFDNSSDTPIALDSVTVEVAGHVFDLWGRNLTVQPHATLILAQTNGENFDSSDVRGSTCTSIGTIPHVRVTMGGVLTTYNDTNQVLNTKDIDLAVCPGGPNESHAWERIGGGGTPVNHALPPAASLTMDPNTAAATVGLAQSFTITAMDASGHPVTDLPVNVQVFGVNTRTLTGTTDAAGIVTVSYIGTSSGKDEVQARAFVTGMLAISDVSTITWANPAAPGGGGTPSPFPPPSIGSVTPADGATVTEPVAIRATITPPAGESITDWTVTYQRVGTTGTVEIASGTGDPPATLATFDPTLVPNGTYVIAITANASNGGFQTSTTTLVVDGNLKLGRYTTTYQDLSVGVAGMPMQVLRTYDSFDKSVGDFGVGWRVEISNFRASSGRPLGLGGWTMYNKQCFFGICLTGFTTSIPHVVTVTWPDGHQELFDFTPGGGSNIFWTGTASFTGRARATSKLAVDGSDEISSRGDGNLYAGGIGSSTLFDPQRFRLTAKDGTVYLLDRTTGLVSSTDRSGNSLTVTPDGITSSRGPAIVFHRTAGRIDTITGPGGAELVYGYDPAGNLSSFTDPNLRTFTYTYDGDHNLKLTEDPLGRPFQTLHYTTDGRLDSVTDGTGFTTHIDDDVSGRTETVTDAEGRLTTISTMDARGNVVERRDLYDGKTAITSFKYDTFDNVIERKDPLGHTWTAQYDEQRLRFMTDPTQKTTEIRYDDFGYPVKWIQPRGGETDYGWDPAGNLTSITDALTFPETYTYDGQGNRMTRTDREQQTWTYTYWPGGQLKSNTDPLLHATTYEYFDDGRLKTETDATNRVTSYTYWPDGQLKSVTKPGNLVTSYTYDELGLLATKTDPAGKLWRWTYDPAGRLREAVDPLDHVTSYDYDRDGRLIATHAPDTGVTTTTYDGLGNVASTEDPMHRTTSYAYDLAGRLESVTNAADGTSHYVRDDAGRVLLERDPLGHETVSTYDDDGNLATVRDPLLHTTRYDHNLADRLVTVTDAMHGVTRTGYDRDGRVTSVQNPELETTRTVYDEAGRVSKSIDGLQHDTTFGYDDAGRLVSTRDALGNEELRTYDPAGRLATVRSAAGVTTTYGYDPRGMVASITDPLGHGVVRTFDDAGRVSTERDARSHTTTFGYDPVNRLQTITDQLGGTVTLGYDLAGELTSITDPRNKTWSTTYDALGGVKLTTDPLNHQTDHVYDATGRLTTSTDGRGVDIAYGHDDAGNLTSMASAGESVAFTYDALNRRQTMTDPTGLETWSYDGASRLTSMVSPAGSIAYTYDDAGRRQTMTIPRGTYTYDYFDNGWLKTVKDPAGATFGFTYLADGRPNTTTRPNGVTTTDGYDAAGRLTSVTHTKGAATVAAFTYTLDENGNRRSMTGPSGTETYALNELDQLVQADLPGHVIGYTYDAAGNRKTQTVDGATTTYTYNDASQLVSAGATGYTYDGNGSRLSAGTDSYRWDDLGRLTGTTIGGSTTTYAVDGDGRRVAATHGSTTTPYLWDVAASHDELVSDGTSSFLHANGSLLQQTSSASTTYPLGDALGSIRAITDSSGATAGSATFDPFGTRTSTGVASPFGFTGELTGADGLVDLRARALDPSTGIFLSTDPIRPGADGAIGFNPYSYVANNPTTFRDPAGGFAEYAGDLTVSRSQTVAVSAIGIAIRLRLLVVVAALVCLELCGLADTFYPPSTVGDPPLTLPDSTMDDVVQDVFDQFKTRVGPITQDIARTIVEQCLASVVARESGGDPASLCGGTRFPIFVTGGDVRDASTHDLLTIAGHPSWARLNYGPNAFPRGWYGQAQYGRVCVPNGAAKTDCHEYPYYSTTQAGPGANVAPVDSTQNQEQGRRLNIFYNVQCGVSTSATGQFGVLPIPLPGVPTGGLCP